MTLPEHPDAARPLARGSEGTLSPYRAAEVIAARVLAAG